MTTPPEPSESRAPDARLRDLLDQAEHWLSTGGPCTKSDRDCVHSLCREIKEALASPPAEPAVQGVDPCYLKLAKVADEALEALREIDGWEGLRLRLDAALTACQANRPTEPAKPPESGLLAEACGLLRESMPFIADCIALGDPADVSDRLLYDRMENFLSRVEARQAEAPKVEAVKSAVRSDKADKEFQVAYEFNGCKWSSSVWATTWEEAEMKLKAMALGTIDGRIVGREGA